MTTTTTTSSWSLLSEKLSIRHDHVRVCTMNDYKACARTLAEAFYNDDVAFYFLDVPDNGGKTRADLWPLHLEILEYIVCAHMHNGLVLSIGENHEGVALWFVLLFFILFQFSPFPPFPFFAPPPPLLPRGLGCTGGEMPNKQQTWMGGRLSDLCWNL